MSPQLTVWYNTKCPVCNAGIDWQRSRLARAARAGVIEFRDINLEPDALARFGVTLADVRRRLHGVDADGRLLVGADCAIAIWRATPGDGWLALLAATGTAKAAEIDAFISTALKTVTDDVIPPFERAGGHTVRTLYAPPGALLKHFEAGEPADIFLTGREAIDQLIGEGKIVSGRIDLGTTGIGICVRNGAPKPDVSTPDAFKRAMLAAKTVAYASPAGGSIVGPHIQKIFARL